MELMHIPLSELAIAKVNVRHGVKKADYKDLIPSIKERGICNRFWFEERTRL